MVKRKFLVLCMAVTLLSGCGSVYAAPVDSSVSDPAEVVVSETAITSKIIGADGLKIDGTKTYPKGTVLTGTKLLENLVVTDLNGKDIGSKEKIIFFNGKGKEFTADAYAEVINTELKNGAAKSYISCYIPYGGNFDFKIAYSDVAEETVPADIIGNPAFEIPANTDIIGDILRNHFQIVDINGKDLGMKDKIRFMTGKGAIITPEEQATLLIAAFKENVRAVVPVIALVDGYPSFICDANILLGQVATKPYSITYATHVQDVGWQEKVKDGTMSGTTARSLRLEGITIESGIDGVGVEYTTHVQDIGWQGYVANGTMSGTSARSLRLEAIKIRLTGENATKYDVYYRVHAQNVGWMGWAKNDAQSGTAGFSYRLEGIEIKIVEKGADAPGTTVDSFRDANGLCSAYQAFLLEKQAGLVDGEYLQYYLGDLDSAGLTEMIVAKANKAGVINDYWICQSSTDGLQMVLAKAEKVSTMTSGSDNMRIFVTNNQTVGKAFQITFGDYRGIIYGLNDSKLKYLGKGNIHPDYKDGATELKPVIFK